MNEKSLLDRKIFNSVKHIALLLYLEAHLDNIEIDKDRLKKLEIMLGTDFSNVLTDLIKLDYIYLDMNINADKNKMTIQLSEHGKVFIKRIINVCENGG